MNQNNPELIVSSSPHIYDDSSVKNIMRSVFIDASSVKFLDEKMMKNLKEVDYLKDYLNF